MMKPGPWDLAGMKQYNQILYNENKRAALEGRPLDCPSGLPTESLGWASSGYEAGLNEKLRFDSDWRNKGYLPK